MNDPTLTSQHFHALRRALGLDRSRVPFHNEIPETEIPEAQSLIAGEIASALSGAAIRLTKLGERLFIAAAGTEFGFPAHQLVDLVRNENLSHDAGLLHTLQRVATRERLTDQQYNTVFLALVWGQ